MCTILRNYGKCQNADFSSVFLANLSIIPESIHLKQKAALSSMSSLSAHMNNINIKKCACNVQQQKGLKGKQFSILFLKMYVKNDFSSIDLYYCLPSH